MRTKNLFKTLVAATLALVSMNSFGQSTAAGPANTIRATISNAPTATSPQAVDFATVGSSMPYNVTSDQEVAKMTRADAVSFPASEFNWRVDTDPLAAVTYSPAATDNANRTVRNDAGAVLTPSGTTANNYTDTSIVVSWLTAGQYDIAVRERSRNTLGFTACDGSDSTLRVFVMPRPTIDWNETAFTGLQGTAADNKVGGCGTAVPGAVTPWAIPVSITSYTQDMKIAYSVTKYSLAGVAGATTTQTLLTSANYGTDNFYTATPTAPNTDAVTLVTLSVPDPSLTPALAYGRWEYTITAVNDLTSRKSGVVSQAADIPAGNFIVYSFPTPITGTIKHVNNTGW